MNNFYPSRRGLLSVLSGAALSACVPFAKTSPFWGTISAGVGGGSKSDSPVTREHASKLPYASMLARFGNAPNAFLVLAEVGPGPRWTWHSADRQAITTYGAFVTSAIGIDIDLRGTRFQGGWSANPLDLVGKRLERTIDVVPESGRVEVPLTCRFEQGGSETVDILGVTYQLERVDERVSSGGQHRYTNRHWIEASTGRCWKSEQIVVPTLPALTFEILKYPG